MQADFVLSMRIHSIVIFFIAAVFAAAVVLSACGEPYQYSRQEEAMRKSLSRTQDAILVLLRGVDDSHENGILDSAMQIVVRTEGLKLFQIDSAKAPRLWLELGGKQGCHVAAWKQGAFAGCTNLAAFRTQPGANP